ncbi:pyruvate kinase [Flavilitoribacter nigricans]|nr:pyruvate kinase [Flavilitoribacter nigricans]
MTQEQNVRALIRKLLRVRKDIIEKEIAVTERLGDLNENHRHSASNLVRYLALRTFNLRNIQPELSNLGISSIGTSERYTLTNLDNILHLLHLLVGEKYYGEKLNYQHRTTVFSSWDRLQRNAVSLFGQTSKHTPHIMVTMPSDAAEHAELVERLLNEGMTVARINCGHDDEEVWLAIIDLVRTTAARLNKSCKIYMDLAGPKIRTGPVAVIQKKKKKKNKKPVDYLSLHIGDPLRLYRTPLMGMDAVYDDQGNLLQPARIALSLPAIFDDLGIGDAIWFDDGKIGAVVHSLHEDYALLKITHAGIKGGRLRAEKGINLPGTHLNLPSLTDDDLAALPFVAAHADIVGYSFVRHPEDVHTLRRHLISLGREDIGLVLKIENRTAFKNLPNLLLAGMQHASLGVMLARGDLAIEVGWERISEVQEQILWICEAAHVPIIWATQVLESLAKRGTASRAEITDAAMSNRAECVMLNKGPFIVAAVQMLGDILNRMYAHQWKKKETLRKLQVAKDFFRQELVDL